MLFKVHTVSGLLLIFVGGAALWSVWRGGDGADTVRNWRKLRWLSFLFGGALAFSTLYWPTAFGYAYQMDDGLGRVVGLPFLVAIFDGRGRDLVGPLTLPSAIANAFVWLSLPAMGLALYACFRQGS